MISNPHKSKEEIIDIFFNSTLNIINQESEIPKFNIIFKESFYNERNPITYNEELPTIIVKNSNLFFELLTSIVNSQIDLYDYYNKYTVLSIAHNVLKRIWLRMEPTDFSNVEHFLKKQLDFLLDRKLDNPNNENYLKEDEGFLITYQTEVCETFCETSKRMHFRIYDGENYHDLPNIYYGIRLENDKPICYIYGVQTQKQAVRNKNIERKLYSLTSNLEEKNVHPNFLMAMSLFYELLKSQNITHIKVPLIQVLSYEYHKLISKQVKEDFEHLWEDKYSYILWLKNNPHDPYFDNFIKSYDTDLEHYKRYVDKEDFISRAKTEGLINLFEQMTNISESEINTDIFIQASYLDISLTKKRRNKTLML